MVSNQKNYSIQRLTPEEFLKSSKDFAFVVLYQPNPSFADAYNFVKENNINTFTVAGPETDWAFLNRIQQRYAQEISQYKEAYQAVFNTNFDAFALDPLDFEDFPPLQSDFGSVAIRMPHQVLLYKSVGGLETKKPTAVYIPGRKYTSCSCVRVGLMEVALESLSVIQQI